MVLHCKVKGIFFFSLIETEIGGKYVVLLLILFLSISMQTDLNIFLPDFVPNTSDDEGRYKIGNQANVGRYNLDKLKKALNPLLEPQQQLL